MESDPVLPEILPRLHFGAPLEPPDRVLHGAGQDEAAWRDYRDLVDPAGLRPDFFMAYAGVKGLSRERLVKWRPYWTEEAERPLLQLGLSMTTDGQPELCYAHEVADGVHDAALHTLGEFLSEEGLSVLLRIGYECTGPWNGYEPASYVAAFQRVASLLRAYGLPLATVWCVEGGWSHTAEGYYPGDTHVDWFSVDLFSSTHFAACAPFMEEALTRKKPVLIGECTPRRVGVLDGHLSWESWYGPFFAFMAGHPHLKGFSYINWEWSRYPQWSDWGDARLRMNPYVMRNWLRHVRAFTRP